MNSAACPPVLILAFNREGSVNQLVKALSEVKPSKVYVTVDGPRAQVPEDAAKVARVREILSNLPWEHELHTLFREQNLGCGPAVSDGISWFFKNEPEGIILEDDILPHPSMFGFMAEMLERYRDDERVTHISGGNYSQARAVDGADYFFSRYVNIWGWASWRRAWDHFEFDMTGWDKGALKQPGLTWRARKYLEFAFGRAVHGLGTWDYQWKYAAMRHGIAVTPNQNMSVTTGFGEEANGLHHEGKVPPLTAAPADLKHPDVVDVVPELEREMFGEQLARGSWPWELSRLIVQSPVAYHQLGRVARAGARRLSR